MSAVPVTFNEALNVSHCRDEAAHDHHLFVHTSGIRSVSKFFLLERMVFTQLDIMKAAQWEVSVLKAVKKYIFRV